MGRVTELIYYINTEYEPDALVKRAEYSHISFTDEIEKKGKDYRKQRKREKKLWLK